MKLIQLQNSPILEQLKLEEALLRTTQEDFCLLNSGSPPAIVMGASGDPKLLFHDHNPYPVIRRYSGGGCVVVDENTLFITFIGTFKTLPSPDKIHTWAEEMYKPLFSHLPFTLTENDYCLGEKKFGGNAQHIARNRFVHHTSLLWSFDPAKMNLLKMPPKIPTYRQARPHTDFLTTLEPHFPDKDTLFAKIKDLLNLNETTIPSNFPPHRQATQLIRGL